MTGPAAPNGTERPGEHWNARLVREATDRAVHAMAGASHQNHRCDTRCANWPGHGLSTTVDTHAGTTGEATHRVISAELAAVLRDVADEQVYTSPAKGYRAYHEISGETCESVILKLMALGLVQAPPEGGSFYQLTDAAEPYIRAARAAEPGLAVVVPAIAHDRQPYPTADAYEAACRALEKHRARADAAEGERDQRDLWARDVAVWHGMTPEGDDDLYATIAKHINAITADLAEWRLKYNRQCLHALALIAKLGPVAEGAQALIDEAAGQSLRDEPPAPKMATDERSDVAIAALATLVHLKDGPRDDDYRHRIDAAWDRARWVVLGFGGQAASDDH